MAVKTSAVAELKRKMHKKMILVQPLQYLAIPLLINCHDLSTSYSETAGTDSAPADPVAEPVSSEYVGAGARIQQELEENPCRKKLLQMITASERKAKLYRILQIGRNLVTTTFLTTKPEYANYFTGKRSPTGQ